jgi:recombination protein RecA
MGSGVDFSQAKGLSESFFEKSLPTPFYLLDLPDHFRYIFASGGEHMANHALAALESALRARKLDRTLTTALAPLERMDPSALMPMDVAVLDTCLRGGLPRGQLSELAGPRSSGRMTLFLQMVAAATQRGEIAALVDTLDRLDVASAAAAGVDLSRLLWIRGQEIAGRAGPFRLRQGYGGPPELEERRLVGPAGPAERSIDRALKALNLVLQAGGFGVVAIDLADVPPAALRQIPFMTWLRVQRAIEGSDTACVLLTSEPLARSAGGLTVSLTSRATWAGTSDRSRRLAGVDMRARVVSPRKRIDGTVTLSASAIGG